FGDPAGLATIHQVLNTTPGVTYRLSYWMASDGGFPNEFKVTWGGATLFDQSNIPFQNYTLYTFDLTATGTTTDLAFSGFEGPGAVSLDDVSVTPLLTGNALEGVQILDAANNVIGSPGAGNVISGNAQRGVFIDGSGATGNVVQSNII